MWLWPNLLSLDAPLVALLWQIFFARCFGVRLDAAAAALLILTVWLIYSFDRTLDAWRREGSSPRHQFYGRYWRTLLPLWAAALGGAAWLASRHLPPDLFLKGIAILGASGAYLGFVHCGRMQTWCTASIFRLAKESCVGILFGLGASVVVWSQVKTPADLGTIVLFSGLCWMNCVAIQKWEGERLEWSPNVAALILAGAACIPLCVHRPLLGGAEIASSLAFIALNRARPRLSVDAVRVLADVALLSPLFFLPAAH